MTCRTLDGLTLSEAVLGKTMETETQRRFLTLEQGVIFHIGRIEGLVNTTRYPIPHGLDEELIEIRDGLRDLVRQESARKSYDVPN